MIVCHCRKVTDRDVKAAIFAGAETEEEVARMTGAGTCCGGCRPTVNELLTKAGRRPSLVVLPIAESA